MREDHKANFLSVVFAREILQNRDETRRGVISGAQLSASYFLMNGAATLIAGYGLLSNSEAVIIGAMLIAMLYGPILCIGLALAELDSRMLMRAVVTEGCGALWVFSLGILLGLVHSKVPSTDQLLARASPNILDMMIALVGGAAGAYAAASPRVSGVVVGVAISTALCPPLTACGILIAHGYFDLASGAFLLFLTNLTAIAVAAMITFLIIGHRAQSATVAMRKSWVTRIVPLVMLAVLGIYLLEAFRKGIDDVRHRSQIEVLLREGLRSHSGSRVIEVRLAKGAQGRDVFALITSPKPISSDVVAKLNDAINRVTGINVYLHVQIALIEEITRDGSVFDKSPANNIIKYIR